MTIPDLVSTVTTNTSWSKRIYVQFRGPRDFDVRKKDLTLDAKKIIQELREIQGVLKAVEISSASSETDKQENIKQIDQYNNFSLVIKPQESFKTIIFKLDGGHLSDVEFEIFGRSRDIYDEMKHKANIRLESKCTEENSDDPKLCPTYRECIFRLCKEKIKYRISWTDCIDGTGGVSVRIAENLADDCNRHTSTMPEL